jgi:hypothetical protein
MSGELREAGLAAVVEPEYYTLRVHLTPEDAERLGPIMQVSGLSTFQGVVMTALFNFARHLDLDPPPEAFALPAARPSARATPRASASPAAGSRARTAGRRRA